jgi:hypothetical protein
VILIDKNLTVFLANRKENEDSIKPFIRNILKIKTKFRDAKIKMIKLEQERKKKERLERMKLQSKQKK